MRVMRFAAMAVAALALCGPAGAGLYLDYAREDATVDDKGAFYSGTEGTLSIQGYSDAPPMYSLGSLRRVFLQFDISDIPEWAQIVTAEFGIYMVGRNTGGAATVDPHAALYIANNDLWDQTDITWDTKPDYLPGFVDEEKALAQSGQYYVWNLLSDMGENSWTDHLLYIQSGRLSLMLKTWDEGDNNYAVFNSTEAAEFRPYLNIVYVPEPASLLLLGIGGFMLARRK